MKSAKPAIVSTLKKGVIIDAIPGIVDTFNWIVSCFENMKTKDGKEVDGLKQGSPVIGGGDEEITINGTDGSSATGKTITFATETDSNVKVSVSGGGDNPIVVSIGVYYK